MKAFALEICAAVRSGRLGEPFTAKTAKLARPGWADRTYALRFFRLARFYAAQ